MTGAPVLRTARLILRPHEARDFEPAAAMWADPGVARYTGGSPSRRQDSWMRLLRYPGLWAILGYGYWAIEEAESGLFAGEAGLADFKREMTPSIDDVPEAGWALSPRFHGRGYAQEALTAILGWADTHLDAPRTCCIIDPGNAPSIRLAAKLGFEGPHPARFRGSDTLLFYRNRQ